MGGNSREGGLPAHQPFCSRNDSTNHSSNMYDMFSLSYWAPYHGQCLLGGDGSFVSVAEAFGAWISTWTAPSSSVSPPPQGKSGKWTAKPLQHPSNPLDQPSPPHHLLLTPFLLCSTIHHQVLFRRDAFNHDRLHRPPVPPMRLIVT